jgi:hypothetical protein
MALAPIVDSLDAIPEFLKREYKEDPSTGKFLLDVVPTNGYVLENIDGLKSALGKERQRASEFESKVKALGDIDPVAVKTKLQRLAELEALDPVKEADKIAEAKAKNMIDQVISKHQQELSGLASRADTYKSTLNQVLVDEAAKNAIVAAGGDEKTINYMLHQVKAGLKLVEHDGKFYTQVVDQAGNPRIGDAQGGLMTIKQYVDELKGSPIWADAFPGRSQSGGGKQPGGKPGTGTLPKKSEMTTAQKTAFIREHGAEKYHKLK